MTLEKLASVDYGHKKVGLASTDESGLFALPRKVLPNDENLLTSIEEFCKQEGIETVVIGESKNYEGKPNIIMEKILEFKRNLEERGLKTVLHPEILTTMEAVQLQGRSEMTDASAAAIILKSYIDTVYNKRA
jgi:putative holliday junction resolvase